MEDRCLRFYWFCIAQKMVLNIFVGRKILSDKIYFSLCIHIYVFSKHLKTPSDSPNHETRIFLYGWKSYSKGWKQARQVCPSCRVLLRSKLWKYMPAIYLAFTKLPVTRSWKRNSPSGTSCESKWNVVSLIAYVGGVEIVYRLDFDEAYCGSASWQQDNLSATDITEVARNRFMYPLTGYRCRDKNWIGHLCRKGNIVNRPQAVHVLIGFNVFSPNVLVLFVSTLLVPLPIHALYWIYHFINYKG